MNPWQQAQQFKHLLQTLRWDAAGQGLVFGAKNVHVYGGAVVEAAHPAGFPFALVQIGAGTADEDDPSLLVQTFDIAVCAKVPGDKLGEMAVIGRKRDYGASAGAGCAEIASRARAAVQDATPSAGGSMLVSTTGTETPGPLASLRHVAVESFTVTCYCTSQPRQTAPQELRLSGQALGWNGDHCEERFDFVDYAVGFVTGTDPVDRYENLDAIVYTGTNPETSVGALPGRVYHVFARYNGHGGATDPAEFSAPEVGSYLIV